MFCDDVLFIIFSRHPWFLFAENNLNFKAKHLAKQDNLKTDPRESIDMLYAHFPDASCFKKIFDTIKHYGQLVFHCKSY